MNARALLSLLIALLLAMAPLLVQGQACGEPACTLVAEAAEGSSEASAPRLDGGAVARRMEAPPRATLAGWLDPDLPEPERPPRTRPHFA